MMPWLLTLCASLWSESLMKPTGLSPWKNVHTQTDTGMHTDMQTHRHPYAYFRKIRKSPRATPGSSRFLWALIKTLSLFSPGPLQWYFPPHRSPLVSAELTPWLQFLLEHHNLRKAFPDHLITSVLQSSLLHPSYMFCNLPCLIFLQVCLTI